MALPSATISFPSTSISTFRDHPLQSRRILALLGAGLSASSGLSTFRGIGSDGLWQNHDAAKLATPQAFEKDPHLAWQFYQERRQQALDAEPNAAHIALAKLAKQMGEEGFVAVSMNIDGLCKRAGHPEEQLLEVHGSLFDLKCSTKECDYFVRYNFDRDLTSTPHAAQTPKLPKCPTCSSLLRPGLVWFGESLPEDIVAKADAWIQAPMHIDLVLVIGTTAQVWPASGYVDAAIETGARVAVVNVDRGDLIPGSGELGLTDRDWIFTGDAARIVPEMLRQFVDGV